MQWTDKENKWLITVHPTQLKMKHRHKTSERHILHRHILTAMTKQCNHKQKAGNLSLFVGSAGWMYSSREKLLFPCHYCPFSSPCRKKWLRESVTPDPAGSNLFLVWGSAFPGSSQLRCVLCSRWDVYRLNLDTNYLIEIWGSWEIPTFCWDLLCHCEQVAPLGAEVPCDFKIQPLWVLLIIWDTYIKGRILGQRLVIFQKFSWELPYIPVIHQTDLLLHVAVNIN